eukprot:g24169.t1
MEVPLLELAMQESVRLAQNSRVLKGPWEILQELDLELRDFKPAQSRKDLKALAVTKDTADEISSAAEAIPEDVRQRLWRGIGGDQSAAMAEGSGGASPSRISMKAELFQRFDLDGDGFLYSEELKNFAAVMEGLDFRGFSRMVDDEEAGYLEDEEMAEILSGA